MISGKALKKKNAPNSKFYNSISSQYYMLSLGCLLSTMQKGREKEGREMGGGSSILQGKGSKLNSKGRRMWPKCNGLISLDGFFCCRSFTSAI